MASSERILVRSRATYVCNGTAKISPQAGMPSLNFVSSEGPVIVSFSEGEPIDAATRRLVICTALEREISGNPAVAFKLLREFWNAISNPVGTHADRPNRPEDMPALNDILKRLGAAKNEAARTVAALYRWRWRLDVPAQSLQYKGGEVAYDDTPWVVLGSANITINVGMAMLSVAVPHHVAELDSLLASGTTEPLSHELLTEAYGLQKTAPRSALLLSCTALEVGIKQFIADLQPQTSWLLSELPSPPVDRLLREYVPTLPRRACMRDRSESFSKPFIDEVKKAIHLRNRVAHRGHSSIDGSWLEQWIKVCRDLFYLFDVYRGHTWAANFIQPSTLELMIVSATS